uniref:TIL domain containing protein n=1 Tax=Rhipicephalus appendiculatus TaxID=34631 RepID=A0A131YF54_RHIAP
MNELESALRQPGPAGHASTIPMRLTNVTSTHQHTTSSSDNANHTTVTSSEVEGSMISGGGREYSTGLDTRGRHSTDTRRNIAAGTSRNTELAVTGVSAGFGEETVGAPSTSTLRTGHARVPGEVTRTRRGQTDVGRSTRIGVPVTSGLAFGEATVWAPSTGTLRPSLERITGGVSESATGNTHDGIYGNTGASVPSGSPRVNNVTIGAPSAGMLRPGSESIASVVTGSTRGNIHAGSSGDTAVPITSDSTGVIDATSRTPSSYTLRRGPSTAVAWVVSPAEQNMNSANSRNTRAAVPTASSGGVVPTVGASSTGTLRLSPTRTAGIVPESEAVNTYVSGNTGILSSGTSEGSPRSISQPQGVVLRPGHASQPVITDLTNGTPTGLGDTRSTGSAGNNTVHISEGTHYVTELGRTGGRGEAEGSIGVTHSTESGRNVHINTPRNSGNTRGSGSSELGLASVRVPSDGALHPGLAHMGTNIIAPGPVSTLTTGSSGTPSANAEASPNNGENIPGNAARSRAPGPTPPASMVRSHTDFRSGSPDSGPHLSSEGTRFTDSGTLRQVVPPGRTMVHGGSAGEVVTHGAIRTVTASTGTTVNRPEATTSITSRGSPFPGTITGLPAVESPVSEERNRFMFSAQGASVNNNIDTGIGSRVNAPDTGRIHNPVGAVSLIYGTRINRASLSENTSPSISTSTNGETSLGANTFHLLNTAGRGSVLPGRTPSSTVDLSHSRGSRVEGSPAIANGNVLPPLNEGASLASMLSAALGLHAESATHREVVPLRSNSNREQNSAGAVNGGSSVSTVMISAPRSHGVMPTAGTLTGVRVSAGGGAAANNTGTIATAGAASPLSLITEGVGGIPTGANESTPGSIGGATLLDRIPTVHSGTAGLGNILGSISVPSSSTADTRTRAATDLYPAMTSDSMPVGAEALIRALTASGSNGETAMSLRPQGAQPSLAGTETTTAALPHE